MEYQALIEHFGGVTKAAKALGLAKQTVDSWSARRIPTKHQLKASVLSGNKLKIDAKARADAKEFAQLIEARAA